MPAGDAKMLIVLTEHAVLKRLKLGPDLPRKSAGLWWLPCRGECFLSEAFCIVLVRKMMQCLLVPVIAKCVGGTSLVPHSLPSPAGLTGDTVKALCLQFGLASGSMLPLMAQLYQPYAMRL